MCHRWSPPLWKLILPTRPWSLTPPYEPLVDQLRLTIDIKVGMTNPLLTIHTPPPDPSLKWWRGVGDGVVPCSVTMDSLGWGV